MTVRDGLCDAIGIKMNQEETGIKSSRTEATEKGNLCSVHWYGFYDSLRLHLDAACPIWCEDTGSFHLWFVIVQVLDAAS